MPYQKPKLRDVLGRLKPLDEAKDNDFDSIPGWDGVTIEAMTDNAVLIVIRGENVWLPISQLRSTIGDDVLASQWIIDQKGLA